MIYQMHVRQIAPGKMPEYRELQVKEMIPMQQRVGQRVMGHFNTLIGNSNETIAIYAYENMAQFEKIREAMMKDPGYQSMSTKLNAMTVTSNSRFMTPSEWSAMK